jgi:hypothetical protein
MNIVYVKYFILDIFYSAQSPEIAANNAPLVRTLYCSPHRWSSSHAIDREKIPLGSSAQYIIVFIYVYTYCTVHFCTVSFL